MLFILCGILSRRANSWSKSVPITPSGSPVWLSLACKSPWLLQKNADFDSAAVRIMLKKARDTFFELRERSALGAEDAMRLNTVLNELQRF